MIDDDSSAPEERNLDSKLTLQQIQRSAFLIISVLAVGVVFVWLFNQDWMLWLVAYLIDFVLAFVPLTAGVLAYKLVAPSYPIWARLAVGVIVAIVAGTVGLEVISSHRFVDHLQHFARPHAIF